MEGAAVANESARIAPLEAVQRLERREPRRQILLRVEECVHGGPPEGDEVGARRRVGFTVHHEPTVSKRAQRASKGEAPTTRRLREGRPLVVEPFELSSDLREPASVGTTDPLEDERGGHIPVV